MLTIGDTQAGIPAFLVKLWRLVQDPTTDELISWRPDGLSFVIKNQSKFSSELLPLNYKHNNMASFIRQLNMYGFHKVASIENGGLRFNKDEMEFTHPDFRREEYHLLNNIKRKIAAAKAATVDDKKGAPDSLNRVFSEVKAIRGKQDSLDSRFSNMKQENEALWRELVVLRQKHSKQQQIVNKLIQFLVTIVHPSKSGLKNMNGVKNCYQLMIGDESCEEPESTKEKCGPVIQEYFDEDSIDNIIEGATGDAPEEIDEDDAESYQVDVSRVIEEPKRAAPDNLQLLPVHAAKKPRLSLNTPLPDIQTTNPLDVLNTPIVESPKQDKTLVWYGKQADFLADAVPDDLLENPFEVPGTSTADGQWQQGNQRNNLALAKIDVKPSPDADIFNLNTPEQFDCHLENVQENLASLQEMLNDEGYSLDVNPLDSLFGDSSDLLSYPLETTSDNVTQKKSQETTTQ